MNRQMKCLSVYLLTKINKKDLYNISTNAPVFPSKIEWLAENLFQQILDLIQTTTN